MSKISLLMASCGRRYLLTVVVSRAHSALARVLLFILAHTLQINTLEGCNVAPLFCRTEHACMHFDGPIAIVNFCFSLLHSAWMKGHRRRTCLRYYLKCPRFRFTHIQFTPQNSIYTRRRSIPSWIQCGRCWKTDTPQHSGGTPYFRNTSYAVTLHAEFSTMRRHHGSLILFVGILNY